jgi:pyruvate dehydrogenase E2 component (dihydrolipoamide acetyltransferase)
MAVEIAMPQLSDTMDKGTILSWLKSEGDAVSRGDALAEVATDKADLEIESFHEGTLLKILAPKGTTVQVGEIIALLGEPGESFSIVDDTQAETEPEKALPVVGQPETIPDAEAGAEKSLPPAANDSRVFISPLAKNLAQTHGVSYQNLQGSGEGGRIVRRDIEGALGKSLAVEPEQNREPLPQSAGKAKIESQTAAGFVGTKPLSRMREAIASRMVESVNAIPHFFVTAKYCADELLRMREVLKALPQYEGLTLNHLMIKAAALAVRAVPSVNAHYEAGSIVTPSSINVGILTALDDGLLIPVLKQADELHLADIVAESRSLVQRARAGRPKSEDLSGATFSISNIGKFEVEQFSAIISPGQGAILAISSVQQEALVIAGEVKPANVLRVTLSLDHRILDGVVGGAFLTELKRFVETPLLLLA